MNFKVTFKTVPVEIPDEDQETPEGSASDEQWVVPTTKRPVPLIEKLGQPGIDLLTIIREEHPELANVKCQDIRVDAGCPLNGDKATKTLTEEQALASGHFEGKTNIDVTVPGGFFTQYTTLETEVFYYHTMTLFDNIRSLFGEVSPGKGEAYKSSSRYIFSIDDVYEAWAEAGFPLEWTV